MPSAAILAGGQAQRFGGRDKGALLVDGRSIRERQIAELATMTTRYSDRRRRRRPRGRRRFVRPTPRVVADRVPGCGPLGGLHTALLEATGEPTIVIACDMPYVSAPLLRHLLTLARDADAVVPRTDRGYHPLCAAYTRACIAPIAPRLADGHLKMTDLFADLRVRVVAGDELGAFGDPDRLLANVNSPDAYRELAALHDHQL